VVGHQDSTIADTELVNRSPILVINTGATLTIAGSLTLKDTANIVFYPNSSIVIVPVCSGKPLLQENPSSQFVVSPLAVLSVMRTSYSGTPDLLLDIGENNANVPLPFVVLSDCGQITTFNFWVQTEGDFSSGNFPLIQSASACGWATQDSLFTGVDGILNVTCPKYNSWATDSSVIVDINAPSLCVPQIVGISVGTVAGVAIVGGGAAAVAMGGVGSSAVPADYVTL